MCTLSNPDTMVENSSSARLTTPQSAASRGQGPSTATHTTFRSWSRTGPRFEGLACQGLRRSGRVPAAQPQLFIPATSSAMLRRDRTCMTLLTSQRPEETQGSSGAHSSPVKVIQCLLQKIKHGILAHRSASCMVCGQASVRIFHATFTTHAYRQSNDVCKALARAPIRIRA